MNQDFLDLLRTLFDLEVRFVVVGAHALAVHGRPRATGDIDILIEPTPENARVCYAALQNFGAPLGDLSVEDLHTPGTVFQMGVPPRRIDILTRISGVSFAEAWNTKVTATVDSLEVPFLGRDALIKNKRSTGRPKDDVDANDLESVE